LKCKSGKRRAAPRAPAQNVRLSHERPRRSSRGILSINRNAAHAGGRLCAGYPTARKTAGRGARPDSIRKRAVLHVTRRRLQWAWNRRFALPAGRCRSRRKTGPTARRKPQRLLLCAAARLLAEAYTNAAYSGAKHALYDPQNRPLRCWGKERFPPNPGAAGLHPAVRAGELGNGPFTGLVSKAARGKSPSAQEGHAGTRPFLGPPRPSALQPGPVDCPHGATIAAAALPLGHCALAAA
jgi:hypothetical protein